MSSLIPRREYGNEAAKCQAKSPKLAQAVSPYKEAALILLRLPDTVCLLIFMRKYYLPFLCAETSYSTQ